MKQTRVLIIAGTMEVGGIENQLMNLLRGADRSCFRIDFTTTAAHPFYEDEILSLGGKCIHIPSIDGRHFLRYCKAIYRVMKHGNYDIVHSNELFHSGMVLLIARLAGVKHRFVHAHSSNQEYGRSLIRRLYHWAMRRLILKNATCFLACSSLAGMFLYGEKLTGQANYHVVFNTVDTQRFLPESGNTRTRPADGSKTILQVGRFSDEKNFLHSVRVAAACRDRGDPFRFVFVGNNGNDYETLVRREIHANHLEDIVYLLGLRQDVNELMRQADVFLLPSKYEGMPLTLIEAQAACLPCVVADSFSHEADFGLNAVSWLPPDASAEAWADALEQAVRRTKPARSAVIAAIEEKGFDSSHFVQTILNLYTASCADASRIE